MNILKKLQYYIESLCIYRVERCAVLQHLQRLLQEADKETVIRQYSVFFDALAPAYSLRQAVADFILTDDNPFTRAAAAGATAALPLPIKEGVQADLKKLEAIAALTAQELIAFVGAPYRDILATMPAWETAAAPPPLQTAWEQRMEALEAYHACHGYGQYVHHAAFKWHNGAAKPLAALDTVTLADLKNYEAQRAQIVENTLAFLEGLPANNVLLYGDRGTGKSSTVHAILNEYQTHSLRMIEISKADIHEVTHIREQLCDSPMKFIIFIDDLSFDTHEDSFAALKAALEGSLSGNRQNTLIYATSNRRHLIKENYSDRENDVHRSDSLQEELSLSDRFGLAVYFMNPNKADYLDITEKIARDRALQTPRDKLLAGAENWARRRGGRSPRTAKQFIDYVQSCEKRGVAIRV